MRLLVILSLLFIIYNCSSTAIDKCKGDTDCYGDPGCRDERCGEFYDDIIKLKDYLDTEDVDFHQDIDLIEGEDILGDFYGISDTETGYISDPIVEIYEITAESVIFSWKVDERTDYVILRLGRDEQMVNSGCPNGVGEGSGCDLKIDSGLVSPKKIDGLKPDTLYYYRLAAIEKGSGNSSKGTNGSFRTLRAGCIPDCDGKVCGEDNGCGGICTLCPDGYRCDILTAKCIGSCLPNCNGRICGEDDGCGGRCRACPSGQVCNEKIWQCEGCTPDCTGKCGGPDGCGGRCTETCLDNKICLAPDYTRCSSDTIDCAIETKYFWDCTSCPGGRELSPTGRVYRLNRWNLQGREYLIISNYTSANIYDVTNPDNPILALQGAAYTPWGLIEGSPDDDTQQWDMAILPNNLIGLGMFQNFGWVTFRVVKNNKDAFTGYETLQRFRINPPIYIPTNRGARNAVVFYGNDGKTYAAATYLAKEQSTGGIDIAEISNTGDVRVISSLPDTTARGLIRVIYLNNNIYLITVNSLENSLLFFDIKNPLNPVLVAQLNTPKLKDFDVWQDRLYVIYKPDSTVTASVYNIKNLPNYSEIFSSTGLAWQYNNVTGIGDYLIVSSSANETINLPVRAYYTGNQPYFITFPITPPNGDWFQETEQDTVVYDNGANLYFYRAAWGRASYTIVQKVCFSKN